MRHLGYKRIATSVPGHANCRICHEPTKSGRAYENQQAIKQDIIPGLEDWSDPDYANLAPNFETI